jgi:predicted MPP superfamily phosphohydrolase
MKIKILLLFVIFCSSRIFAQSQLVFLSDCQEPLWVEQIFLKNENNIETGDSLFARITRKEPSAVFFLGDMVANGSSNTSWSRFDKFLRSLKNKKIPYYATPGNHEYVINAKKGIQNFEKRFQSQNKNFVVQIIDSIAVILINSNFSKITTAEKNEMLSNYEKTLSSLDESPTVKHIFVCTHYSPYTNSSVVSPSEEVENLIVPQYLKSKKTFLFLSGHSHNLELFKEVEKYFFVIGGGGGLKQKLKPSEKRKYREIYPNVERYRFFFITIERKDDGILFGLHGMNTANEQEKQEHIFLKY